MFRCDLELEFQLAQALSVNKSVQELFAFRSLCGLGLRLNQLPTKRASIIQLRIVLHARA